MIPKASQRGLGQDLATHLQNAYDNEYVEIADLRGAVARDLHGAFAEWEVCAYAMTGCRNYLYSLSVNPDPAQGQLTRAQYLDYVDRAEAKLNLSGQPRAIVFHIKEGREHCHVVWSRIDAEHSKAVHQAFDHQKLMMVTREFAREHGLALPAGMTPDAGRARVNKRRLSLYEKHQQDTTGLTKEERMAQVTEAWRRSDNARAFVKALEDLGYVLATGKRPYVLVDLYGEMNALPKLIDDRAVRTKDLRAFLERDFPPESLPSVDEARALVAQHRQAIEDFKKAQAQSDRVDALKRSQTERRRPLEAEQAAMQARHAFEKEQLGAHQHGERRSLQSAFDAETKRIDLQRGDRRGTGLVAILARVSGFNLLRRTLDKHQDHRRQERLIEDGRALDEAHTRARLDLQRRHEAQGLDLDRRLRGLAQVDARELQSLDTAVQREQRVRSRARGGGNRMPALTLDLKPRGRRDVAFKAKNRHGSRVALEEMPSPAVPEPPPSVRETLRAPLVATVRAEAAATQPVARAGTSPDPTRRGRAGRSAGASATRTANDRAIHEATRPTMSDELVNSERVTIVKGDPVRDFWLGGTVNRCADYSFKAKVYDVGSIFGIGEGWISKLQVWREGREVMSYDRGWDQVPNSRRDMKALKEILAGFPEPGKETSRIEVVHMERQASRRRFRLFGQARLTGWRGQRRVEDYER